MDMRLFVESLTLSEMNELSNIIYEKRRDYARMNARPLSDEEMHIAFSDYMGAIKLYRTRVGVGLVESKVAVDVYRESYGKVYR